MKKIINWPTQPYGFTLVGEGSPKASTNKGCVTLWALPFTWKKYLKAKEEELWKLKYFTMQKYINLQKNPLKETHILINSVTNLKFQHKSKYHLSKILI